MRSSHLRVLATTCFLIVANAVMATVPTLEEQLAVDKLSREFDREIVFEEGGMEMTVESHLQLIVKELNKHSKIKITIVVDADAFGIPSKDILKSKVKLPALLKRIPAANVLRIAISQVEGIERYERLMDAKGTLTVTTVDRSLTTRSYDIRPLLRIKDRWIGKELRNLFTDVLLKDADRRDPTAILVKGISTFVQPDEWRSGRFSMQVNNQRDLVVRASPSGHEEIAWLLRAVEGASDVAVEVNAKLLEIDAEKFAEFSRMPKAPETSNGPAEWLFLMSRQQFVLIEKIKPIARSEPVKMIPEKREVFISREKAVVYRTWKINGKEFYSILAGIECSVIPSVSADRRHISLRISQDYVGVILEKLNEGEEVDRPNVRRSTLSDTIKIDDGSTICMWVRPPLPAEVAPGRQWIIVMQPTIDILAEQRLIDEQSKVKK